MVGNILRLGAAVTILLLGGLLFILWRLDLSAARSVARKNQAAAKARYAQ
jgi:hypothetical protein